ncbi:MAG: RNA polymerase sigma factor [Planctomycetes bacterium]|nr:RNA polymerase sigma factor [Planctomycetota bacterium]
MENTRFAYFSNLEKTLNDAEAMERSAKLNADPRVFWDLAEPHKQKLYNFIQKSLSFSTEADDVFQETLLRGLKYFPSYLREKSFSAWLFAIAHNEIRKYVKKSHLMSPLPLMEELICRDERVSLDLVQEVYRFATSMKPKHKEIFFLFYDSGFTITEISRITSIREGNVKFILNRARRTLRECFGEQDEKPRSL